MLPFTHLLKSGSRLIDDGARATRMNVARPSPLKQDISSIVSRVGSDAPQILTRDVQGIKTRIIGGPLSEEHEHQLHSSISRMRSKYPEAHRSIDQLFIDNRPEASMGKKTGFPFLDEYQDEGGQYAAGFAGPVLRGKKIKSSIALRTSFMHGPDSSTASDMSGVYTHEFGHVIQNHLATIEGNLNVDISRNKNARKSAKDRLQELRYAKIDSVRSMNKVATAPLERRLARSNSSLYKNGLLDPMMTHRAFGSTYAASQTIDPTTGLVDEGKRDIELFPEMLALRNRPSMAYRNFDSTEQGMRDFDVHYKARNKEHQEFIKEKYGYDPFATKRSASRRGARPRSNSSIGGIAYLQ